MEAVYVVKTTYNWQPISGVFDELQAGRARMGWSSRDNQDLRLIKEKITGRQPLEENEQEVKRCLGFLTRPVVGDYFIYPHQPARRQFCVVQVTGEYDYSAEENGINGDFRSFRPCSLITPKLTSRFTGTTRSFHLNFANASGRQVGSRRYPTLGRSSNAWRIFLKQDTCKMARIR